MGFSLSHNDELNAFERGTSAAETPMSIRDFNVSAAIQDDKKVVCESLKLNDEI